MRTILSLETTLYLIIRDVEERGVALYAAIMNYCPPTPDNPMFADLKAKIKAKAEDEHILAFASNPLRTKDGKLDILKQIMKEEKESWPSPLARMASSIKERYRNSLN